MSEKLSGKCPNCGDVLFYEENDASVKCNLCDCEYNVAEVASQACANSCDEDACAKAAAPAIVEFGTPESGIVFIEKFFETFDWEEYQGCEDIEIAELEAIVENNNKKNGAIGQTWYLDFKSVAVPLIKKAEGLTNLCDKMAEKYDAQNATEANKLFAIYSKIVKNLLANKEAIIKRLETAIVFAEKFALDRSRFADINRDLINIRSFFARLFDVDEIDKIPQYAKAKDAASRALASKFNNDGIDAESTYKEAVALYKAGGAERRSSAVLFEAVRGYKDSVKYINELNKTVEFMKMFSYGEKYYVYELEYNKLADKAAKQIAKGKEPVEYTDTYSLYEVIDGIPAKLPIITGIEQYITTYGNKYYFLKYNAGIYYYDLLTNEEVCINDGLSVDFVEDEEFDFEFVLNETKVIVKKKIYPTNKKGKLLRKKGGLLNNYSIIIIDLATAECKVLAGELSEVANVFDTDLCYIHTEKVAVDKKTIKAAKKEGLPVKDFKNTLYYCDIESGKSTVILNENCFVNAIHDKKVVYSVMKPNTKSVDLRVFDAELGSDVLIEENAYYVYGVYGGKIFYSIGNDEYSPLICNEFDATNRVELIQNVESIIDVAGNWVYARKGDDCNSVLVKVSLDGEEVVPLCSQLDEILKITTSLIYYTDSLGNLCVARKDGTSDLILASDIDWADINDEVLFYVRSEEVDDECYNYSLYKMDSVGKGAKKLVFNIDSAESGDETSLFYVKAEDIRYKVTKTRGNKTKVRYQTNFVERYFKFNKETEQSEVVISIGVPEYKGKSDKVSVVYEEAPIENA